MSEMCNGFKMVTINMPNGARFVLDGKREVIHSKDVESFFEWLNNGRKNVGLPIVRIDLLVWTTGVTLGRFNELARNGILPSDEIEMAYGESLVVVPRDR